MTIDEFKEKYPGASWLEDISGCERWTNGLEPDSKHESVWFDSDGQECQHPDF